MQLIRSRWHAMLGGSSSPLQAPRHACREGQVSWRLNLSLPWFLHMYIQGGGKGTGWPADRTSSSCELCLHGAPASAPC